MGPCLCYPLRSVVYTGVGITVKQVAIAMVATGRIATAAQIDPSYSPGGVMIPRVHASLLETVYRSVHRFMLPSIGFVGVMVHYSAPDRGAKYCD